MDDEARPGAPMVYPARVVGTQIAHLARAVARAGDEPLLRAICPAGQRMTATLERVPEDDVDQLAWCGACAAYGEHLLRIHRARDSIRRAVSNGRAP